jgi:DNA-binding NtrC family response regulator
MPYRLVTRVGDRKVRHVLSDGENLLGTAPECTVQLADPTISRRHAVLRVSSGSVELEDLGSKNGTTVLARRLVGRHVVRAGDPLAFGSVSACIEEVPEEELEAAIPLPSLARPSPPAEHRLSVGATDSMGSVVAFVTEHLPVLAARLAGGADRITLAQVAGAALFAALPCLAVEIAEDGAPHEGVLFCADRGVPRETSTPLAARAAGLVVRVSFVSPTSARSYAPLVETAVLLLASAGNREAFKQRPEAPTSPPSVPDPPTVVAEVQAIYQDAARVAVGDISVLITGESGTGKEVLARYIHQASRRAGRPFLALNCASLPRDLLEAELFGIEKGVATGVDSRPGKFELAHGGTLFLDEIGDMPPEVQAKLLRVLQEKEVYRIGGREPRPAQTRVISATNRDIDALQSAGSFRADVYHRIADWRVNLPPLRQRRDDIPNLAVHFLARESAGRSVRPAGISRAALDALLSYPWPGNLRQLEREMARAALFVEDGGLLETRHLQPAIVAAATDGPCTLGELLERTERREITRALREAEGDTVAAAAALGIARSTLYRRMKELEVTVKDT